ncbi:response regulator [Paenibacillus sp. SC116]|uniref:response regulator n=1 Tax=Paenibacillus sp. SC116 TaxID=2968986 RepID=UPI00215A8405|nr:response regulator [Paenibacillus sp. SC116]MCR8844289.1 response regulator [Paenibacillus sp. SC116]
MTYRILVVDDELPALGEMEDILKDEPLAGDITLFSHAQQALEWALHNEPDIVLLDIQMPGITGLAFAEQLLEQKPMIEVVFVTAYNQYAVQAFELSAIDYILKPVKPERLQRALSRIHRRHSSITSREKLQPLLRKEDVQQQMADLSSIPIVPVAKSMVPSIYSLGQLQIQSPAGLVKWRTLKVEELFAYLLYKSAVSLDQIITDVFPNSDPDKAKQYVHTCVYQLRRALAEKELQEHIHVSFRDRMYRLLLTDVWHDRDELLNLQTQQSSVEELEDKLALYRGDWCEGLDNLWMSVHREELRERFLWLMQDMINHMKKQGDYRKAIPCVRKLLSLEPWNEDYAMQMVQIYVDSGEKAKAKGFILEFKEQFERELGEALSHEWDEHVSQLFNEEHDLNF